MCTTVQAAFKYKMLESLISVKSPVPYWLTAMLRLKKPKKIQEEKKSPQQQNPH